MSASLESRYTGTLIGAACGDALGGTLEFMSRETILAQHPAGFRNIIGGGWLDLEPGETTDDTAMMLAIARACNEAGVDLDQVAANFVSWKQSAPKDIGNQTSQALSLLETGLRWDEAGERLQRESAIGIAGNGSVMRCAPVALRFRSDRREMVRRAQDTSRITHADPRATWGCVAICQAIAHLLNGGAIGSVLDAASADIQDNDVVAAILAAKELPYDEVRSGGFVIETVTAAFWALIRERTAEEVIVRAVMMGDDTDTTATVAGAMAGAAYGLEAIPQRWREVVQHQEELERIASQLLLWDLEA